MADQRKKKRSLRLWVQIGFTALTNGYAAGFAKGTIYRGKLKSLCLPGLNCYSCPGALGSCPIGSLQAVFGSRGQKIPFYVIGFLMFVGALAGRFVCGWLCPFGLVQDLLYKIPFVKKWKKLPGDRMLRWLKYVLLVLFVILLPLFAVDITGLGQPWFCKYVCPSGTLMGSVPLLLANQALRSVVGWLYAWKLFLLIGIILLSVAFYRPFCRYLCPLGAIYGFFNPIALYRFRVDTEKCTGCKACQRACPMDIPVWEKPNSMECIRCGKCLTACPENALLRTGQRTACGSCRGKKEEGAC